MKVKCVFLVLLMTVPAVYGQKKEQFAEMQRDIASMQDDIKAIQAAQTEKFTALQTLLQQALDSANRANTQLAVMSDKQQSALKDLQNSATVPIATLNSRLDQMAQSFQELKETILDMNSRISKMDAKLQDLQKQIQIGANPAPAPGSPLAAPLGPGGMASSSSSAGCPATLQADTTYSNARRDYTAGSYDLAMQEFSDYVRCFPSTQFAPNAQFYIGDIFYKKGDYDTAVKAFDAVITQFPENNKTADSHYMKGNSLMKLGQRDAAAKEFRLVISKYPDSDAATQAKARLRELGLSTGASRRRK
jgi:tol-pal system protein YbgF